MSQICIIKNALDHTEQEIVQSENALKTFLDTRYKHPHARIYKQTIRMRGYIAGIHVLKMTSHHHNWKKLVLRGYLKQMKI